MEQSGDIINQNNMIDVCCKYIHIHAQYVWDKFKTVAKKKKQRTLLILLF